MRAPALEAIRMALGQSSRPDRAWPVLADAAAAIAHADKQLSRFRDEVRLAALTDSVRQYITATVRVRSVLTACMHVLGPLEIET